MFLFFCGMMASHMVWVPVVVPETGGVPLEELECRLAPRP